MMNKGYTPEPYVADVTKRALLNRDFRIEIWTGFCGQMTLMCIPVCSDIGMEIHKDTDQIIEIRQGIAMVKMGKCKDEPEYQMKVGCGDVIFVPAGTWHNVINTGKIPLKLSSVYAPPHHMPGTVHHTKKDAERE